MRASDGQSLFDVAILLTGQADSAVNLAMDNELSLTGTLFSQDDFHMHTIENIRVVDFHKSRRMKTATACEVDDTHYRIFDRTFDLSFE